MRITQKMNQVISRLRVVAYDRIFFQNNHNFQIKSQNNHFKKKSK